MPKRRTYSAEFKWEAVEMVRSSDVAASQNARELVINPNMLDRWCRETKVDGSESFQGQGKPAMRKWPHCEVLDPAAAGGLASGTNVQSSVHD
jgi:transposase-like protein